MKFIGAIPQDLLKLINMKEKIEELIKVGEGSFPIDNFKGLAPIVQDLETLGFAPDEDRNSEPTNGWQIDFWFYYNNKELGKTICISGGVHDGDFKISIEDLEE